MFLNNNFKKYQFLMWIKKFFQSVTNTNRKLQVFLKYIFNWIDTYVEELSHSLSSDSTGLELLASSRLYWDLYSIVTCSCLGDPVIWSGQHPRSWKRLFASVSPRHVCGRHYCLFPRHIECYFNDNILLNVPFSIK